jgi:ubiquinone/menaquinone biosynthesis C-methylase UbiE
MKEVEKKWLEIYDYDESMHGVELYSNYTKVIISKGHRLIKEICYNKFKENNNIPIKVLDIGCGDTDLYKLINKITDSYVGVEPIKREIEKAEKTNNKLLIRGTAEKLPLISNCIDVALHISTLDHCFDGKKAIEEVLRVLNPNGIGIILLENKGRISNFIRSLLGLEVSHGEEHFYYFNVQDIIDLLPMESEVQVKKSYGFIIGFHWVSKFLPMSLIKLISNILDGILGFVFPNAGQHFIIVIKNTTLSKEDLDIKILCPQCGNSCNKKSDNCNDCNYKYSWSETQVLDYMPEVP